MLEMYYIPWILIWLIPVIIIIIIDHRPQPNDPIKKYTAFVLTFIAVNQVMSWAVSSQGASPVEITAAIVLNLIAAAIITYAMYRFVASVPAQVAKK